MNIPAMLITAFSVRSNTAVVGNPCFLNLGSKRVDSAIIEWFSYFRERDEKVSIRTSSMSINKGRAMLSGSCLSRERLSFMLSTRIIIFDTETFFSALSSVVTSSNNCKTSHNFAIVSHSVDVIVGKLLNCNTPIVDNSDSFT